MSWTDDTDPSAAAARPARPAERKPWSGLLRVRFCPVCGGENVDTGGHGGDGTCACRDCETLFTIVALAVPPPDGGGDAGG